MGRGKIGAGDRRVDGGRGGKGEGGRGLAGIGRKLGGGENVARLSRRGRSELRERNWEEEAGAGT